MDFWCESIRNLWCITAASILAFGSNTALAQDTAGPATQSSSTPSVETTTPAPTPPEQAAKPADIEQPVVPATEPEFLTWEQAWQHSQHVALPEPTPKRDDILDGDCLRVGRFSVPHPDRINPEHKKEYNKHYFKRLRARFSELNDACHQKRYTQLCEGWNARSTYDRLRAAHSRMRKNSFNRAAFARLGRDCHADLASRQFRGNYAMEGGGCEGCRIYLSDQAFNGVRSRLLEGLSYLIPRHDRGQDWAKAAEKIRAANQAIPGVIQDFKAQARADMNQQRARIDAKREAARKNRNARNVGTVLGGILGAALGASPQSISDVGMRQLEQSQQAYLRRSRQLDEDLSRINLNAPTMPITRVTSDDGFRVVLPRFELFERSNRNSQYLPSFGAYSSELPFTKIVRVVSSKGSCTGSFVGPGLVLTNKHCVEDMQGNLKQGLAVSYEYLAYRHAGTRSNLTTDRKMYYVRGVHRTPDRYQDSWKHDWAFLTLTEKQNSGWFGMISPERWDKWFAKPDPTAKRRRDPPRIAVAGYSSDLNQGAYITMDWGCTASRRDDVLYYPCRTWKGASGSPVFATNGYNSRNLILGVNAGTTNRAAGAAAIKVGAFAHQQMYEMRQRLTDTQNAYFKAKEAKPGT